ncbi:MAG TPA: hypothetical protein VGR43_08460 [Dehalococcoidia bacterium]|nr:hypothetical protein [Dehalococcoidia bacterium]
MNEYTCDQCDWKYVWPMGDRIKAVKAHELAHLLGEVDETTSAKIEVPAYLMDDYIESLRAVQWL